MEHDQKERQQGEESLPLYSLGSIQIMNSPFGKQLFYIRKIEQAPSGEWLYQGKFCIPPLAPIKGATPESFEKVGYVICSEADLEPLKIPLEKIVKE